MDKTPESTESPSESNGIETTRVVNPFRFLADRIEHNNKIFEEMSGKGNMMTPIITAAITVVVLSLRETASQFPNGLSSDTTSRVSNNEHPG